MSGSRRHTLNVHAHARLSDRTSVSTRLRVGSNFPVVGYLQERDGGYVAGPRRNAVRLPEYARLDARVNRAFNFNRRRLTLFVEVVNLLGRTNYGPGDGSIRVSTGEAVNYTEKLLPFLPSAGLLVEF